MKNAINFVSKGIKIFDDDFTKIHSCKKCIQTFNGIATMSYPVKTYSKTPFSIDADRLTKALEICEWKPEIKLFEKDDKKYLRIRRSNFMSTLRYTTEYIEKKIIDGKRIKVPKNFIDTIKKLSLFTTQDSDNAWAEAIIITESFAYATNNIVVVRTKLKMKDCLIPKALINLIIKVNEPIKHLLINDHSITIMYPHGGWIETPKIAEKAPAIAAVFNDNISYTICNAEHKKSFRMAIAMTTNAEIVLQKGTIITDNATIKNVKLKGKGRMDSVNLDLLIDMFDEVCFTKEKCYFKGNGYTAILAGRM